MLSPGLDDLIIDNLGDLDSAARRVDVLERAIFAKLDDTVEEWAAANGWLSKCDYYEDGIQVWPAEWVDSDAEPYASLELSLDAGDTGEGGEGEDWYNLTRLLNAGAGVFGFRIKQTALKGGVWKREYRSAMSRQEAVALPRDSDGHFFFPLKMEKARVAQSIRDEALDEAFEPVKAELDKLKEFKKALDVILKPARTAALEGA